MPSSAILFAPGAGAPSSSDWMLRFSRGLAKFAPTQSMDYPYQQAGSRRPDPLPKLIEAHRTALEQLRAKGADSIVLAGKSMGSRVGCHLALSEHVSGIVCFGYPLCGAGNRSKLRDEVLKQLKTPVLFVQGTRDALCPLDLLETVRGQMTAPTELMVIETGDHSLQATQSYLKQQGMQQIELEAAILERVGAFLHQTTGC